MSRIGPEGRSYLKIKSEDLDLLAELAQTDRRAFFASHPDWARLYADRFIAAALCQGAALHYVAGKAGIQDFDVYSFYAANPARRWYAKRKQSVDFGEPKFGRSMDKPGYRGRRVDLLGRGIDVRKGESPIQAIQRWLRSSSADSAKLLAEKAVVMLDPPSDRGKVIWPMPGVEAAV